MNVKTIVFSYFPVIRMHSTITSHLYIFIHVALLPCMLDIASKSFETYQFESTLFCGSLTTFPVMKPQKGKRSLQPKIQTDKCLQEIQDRQRSAHNLSVLQGPVINIVHNDEPDQHAGQGSSVPQFERRNQEHCFQITSIQPGMPSQPCTLQPDQTSSIHVHPIRDIINWNCLRIKINRVT